MVLFFHLSHKIKSLQACYRRRSALLSCGISIDSRRRPLHEVVVCYISATQQQMDTTRILMQNVSFLQQQQQQLGIVLQNAASQISIKK